MTNTSNFRLLLSRLFRHARLSRHARLFRTFYKKNFLPSLQRLASNGSTILLPSQFCHDFATISPRSRHDSAIVLPCPAPATVSPWSRHVFITGSFRYTSEMSRACAFQAPLSLSSSSCWSIRCHPPLHFKSAGVDIILNAAETSPDFRRC